MSAAQSVSARQAGVSLRNLKRLCAVTVKILLTDIVSRHERLISAFLLMTAQQCMYSDRLKVKACILGLQSRVICFQSWDSRLRNF